MGVNRTHGSMHSKGETNRQRIIEAADNLFYVQGFNHTSFSDIADAAGVARGNFYYYFKTKDDILSAVIDMRCEGIRQMLAAWDQEYREPRERLRRYVQILTNEKANIEQYGCPMGSLCTELAKISHAYHGNATDMFEIFRAWLERQFRALGHEDANSLALHLLSRGQGVAMVANMYSDKSFLRREAAELLEWIDSL